MGGVLLPRLKIRKWDTIINPSGGAWEASCLPKLPLDYWKAAGVVLANAQGSELM